MAGGPAFPPKVRVWAAPVTVSALVGGERLTGWGHGAHMSPRAAEEFLTGASGRGRCGQGPGKATGTTLCKPRLNSFHVQPRHIGAAGCGHTVPPAQPRWSPTISLPLCRGPSGCKPAWAAPGTRSSGHDVTTSSTSQADFQTPLIILILPFYVWLLKPGTE